MPPSWTSSPRICAVGAWKCKRREIGGFAWQTIEYKAYGELLIDKLSERLKAAGCAFESRTLRLFRQFARTYPQIGAALTSIPFLEATIWQSLIAKSEYEPTGIIKKR
jgi:hypothetical protein